MYPAEERSIQLDAMIICSCNMLSDRDVRRAVTDNGVQMLTAGQVYDCLGCSARCGRCARTIKRIMHEALAPCEAGCACCPADRDSGQAERFCG